MGLEKKENRLYITLGIVVLLTLLLSVFTWGYLSTDDSRISQIATQNVVQSADTLGAREVVTKELPILPQSMKEQYRTSPPGTIFNNYDIQINNRYSYSYPSYRTKYYPMHRNVRPYYHRYYPSHGFSYKNSFGDTYVYREW